MASAELNLSPAGRLMGWDTIVRSRINWVSVKVYVMWFILKEFGFLFTALYTCSEIRTSLFICLFQQQQNLRKRLRLSEDGGSDRKQSDADELDDCSQISLSAPCRAPLSQISNQPTVRSTHVSLELPAISHCHFFCTNKDKINIFNIPSIRARVAVSHIFDGAMTSACSN